MVKNAYLAKEISILTGNKIGVLAEVSKIAADQRINIDAVAGYALEDNKSAKIMLLTGDNLRLSDALKKANCGSLKENEVVVVELENKAGALKLISAKLAQENIDIKYVYGTVCAGGCPAKIVFCTANNAKALAALKK